MGYHDLSTKKKNVSSLIWSVLLINSNENNLTTYLQLIVILNCVVRVYIKCSHFLGSVK